MGHVKLCSVHLSSQSNQLWHPVAVGKSYRAVNKHGMLSVFILSTLGWSLPWGRFQGGLLNLQGLNTNALLFTVEIFSRPSHCLLWWSIKMKKQCHQQKVTRSFDLLRTFNTNLCIRPCDLITWGMILGHFEYKPIRQTTRAYLWHCGTFARVFSIPDDDERRHKDDLMLQSLLNLTERKFCCARWNLIS